jgi:hypothetical protein
LILAIYSMPLRQGLVAFATQTLNGFLASAPISPKLTPGKRRGLLEKLVVELPVAVEALLNQSSGTWDGKSGESLE